MSNQNPARGLQAVYGAPRDPARVPPAALAAWRNAGGGGNPAPSAGNGDNPTDVRAAIERVNGAVSQFIEHNTARVDELSASVDDISARLAADLIGGGGGSAPSAAVRRGYEDLRAQMLGAPRGEMHSASHPDGGALVPSVIASEIGGMIRERSPLRRVATVVSTSTPDFKKLVQSDGAASGWRGERDPVSETTGSRVHEIVAPLGEVYAYPTVTNHLIQDSQFDLASWLATDVAAEMAAQEAAAFINGDGMKKPAGFLSRETAAQADDVRPWEKIEHVATGNPNGFPTGDPSDALIDLVFKLRAGYRSDPSTAWLMNSATLSACRKLRDVNGNMLWTANLQQGTPSLLLGYPVLVDENMPNMEDGETPIAFANWSRAYMIVDRTETTVIADKVTSPGWTKYYFARRVGGTVVDPRAIKLLKIGS